MKTTTNIYNLIILDASGSMSSIYEQALAGVNQTIETIRTTQQDMPEQPQYLTMVSFADGGKPLQVMTKLAPIGQVNKFTRRDYNLRCMTALYDAIGDAVTELKECVKKNDRALVTIITDGGENDSRRWSQYQVHQLIDSLKEKGWMFTFIGANQDVKLEASRVGIESTLKFEATVEGTIEMFSRENRSRRRWNEQVYRGEEIQNECYFNEEPMIRGRHEGRVTPERIDHLRANEIFVFGSNVQGKHSGGAAAAAMHRFGAQWGKGEGLQGQSYAIPSVGVNGDGLEYFIERFVNFARLHPELKFLVTPIGCGHGGLTPDLVALNFHEAEQLDNVSLPQCFWDVLDRFPKQN